MDRDRPALTTPPAPTDRVGAGPADPITIGTSASTRIVRIVATVVPALFLTIFFLHPITAIIRRGLADGSVLEVLGRSSTGRILRFTFRQAALSTIATFAAGLPAAWAIGTNRIPGRRLVRALVVVPFVLPTLVVATAVKALLDTAGWALDGTLTAIVVAHTMLNTAVVIRIVGGWWALQPRAPEEAARMLGADRLRTFLRVTLPALAPALWSAAAIVFLFCFTSFGIILTVGGPANPTIETEIWRQATRRTDFTAAAAFALVQLVAVLALVAVTTILERRLGAPSAVTPRRLRPIRGLRRTMTVTVALLPAAVLLIVPLGLLALRSVETGSGLGLDHYRALTRIEPGGLFVPALDAVLNSLTAAATAGSIAVVIGGLAAIAAVHNRGGRWIDLGLMIPLGTSAVTIGFGILLALGRPPLDLRSSWIIIPLAQALVGIPFVIRIMVPALRGVDDRQRQAAAVLGASPLRVRLTVDAPVASRALLVGAAFAFAISLGEFGATSFLARPNRPTVPVAMFRLLDRPGASLRGQAMALGTVLALLTAVSVLIIERFRREDTIGW